MSPCHLCHKKNQQSATSAVYIQMALTEVRESTVVFCMLTLSLSRIKARCLQGEVPFVRCALTLPDWHTKWIINANCSLPRHIYLLFHWLAFRVPPPSLKSFSYAQWTISAQLLTRQTEAMICVRARVHSKSALTQLRSNVINALVANDSLSLSLPPCEKSSNLFQRHGRHSILLSALISNCWIPTMWDPFSTGAIILKPTVG